MQIYIYDKKNSYIKNSTLKSKVIKKIIGINEEREIYKSKYGKPYVPNYPNIYFSISHSYDYWVMVVNDYPIGIDIEKKRDINSFDEIIQLLHKDEEEYLSIHRKDFFKVWCFKESYLKLLGVGLNIPLKSFSVVQEQKFKKSIGMFSLRCLYIVEGYEIVICTKKEYDKNEIEVIDVNKFLKDKK
ncbi:4'-phosphopantetheinyl transferase superfamily protein [Hathewaya histolytica]|uniref:Phosphopantetheinyl transferase n=1 Tax=Hathewaya histolytica TaxID=1498 RepID=A0A4U9RQ55_HATHI|nr:4'-phosphopantetheinyl transferase superfamily protein [Hathewaya histolytica]VTQ93631.1 phosphopantetheinyl transferase [Hathewaya histolytica]